MAATMASAMPVLPLVASIKVSPGRIRPRFSACIMHLKSGAVFHRAGRIVALKLGPHLRLRVRGHALQADKRGVADAIGQGLNGFGHVVCRVNVKQAQVITKPPARI